MGQMRAHQSRLIGTQLGPTFTPPSSSFPHRQMPSPDSVSEPSPKPRDCGENRGGRGSRAGFSGPEVVSRARRGGGGCIGRKHTLCLEGTRCSGAKRSVSDKKEQNTGSKSVHEEKSSGNQKAAWSVARARQQQKGTRVSERGWHRREKKGSVAQPCCGVSASILIPLCMYSTSLCQ